MALTWSVSSVTDWEEIVAETRPSPMGGAEYVDGVSIEQMNQDRITTWIIFRSVDIGMNGITSKNVNEFFRRLNVLQTWKPEASPRLFTGSLDDKVTLDNYSPTPVTLEDVQRRIGLSTNASVNTKAKFDSMVEKAMV